MKLENGFSLFGNKGNVWTNTAHISKDGAMTGRTLCGTPMLSHNWVRIEGITEPGCEECIKLYEEELKQLNINRN